MRKQLFIFLLLLTVLTSTGQTPVSLSDKAQTLLATFDQRHSADAFFDQLDQ